MQHTRLNLNILIFMFTSIVSNCIDKLLWCNRATHHLYRFMHYNYNDLMYLLEFHYNLFINKKMFFLPEIVHIITV